MPFAGSMILALLGCAPSPGNIVLSKKAVRGEKTDNWCDMAVTGPATIRHRDEFIEVVADETYDFEKRLRANDDPVVRVTLCAGGEATVYQGIPDAVECVVDLCEDNQPKLCYEVECAEDSNYSDDTDDPKEPFVLPDDV